MEPGQNNDEEENAGIGKFGGNKLRTNFSKLFPQYNDPSSRQWKCTECSLHFPLFKLWVIHQLSHQSLPSQHYPLTIKMETPEIQVNDPQPSPSTDSSDSRDSGYVPATLSTTKVPETWSVIKIKEEENKTIYECVKCKKTFKDPGPAQDHAGLHMGEKRHKCPICSKRFRFKPALLNHKKSHAKNTGFVDPGQSSSRDFKSKSPKRETPPKNLKNEDYSEVIPTSEVPHSDQKGQSHNGKGGKGQDDKTTIKSQSHNETGDKGQKDKSTIKDQRDKEKMVKGQSAEKCLNFKCSLCSEKFARPSELGDHVRESHGRSPSGRLRNVARRHLRTVYRCDIECSICNTKFSSKYNCNCQKEIMGDKKVGG